MPRYRAVISGRNFFVEIDGERQRHGFFQTLVVEAIDPDQAELRAIELVKSSSDLKDLVRIDQGDPPTFYLDSLSEIELTDMPKPDPRGRSWYAETT
jgi:hypothetical protein